MVLTPGADARQRIVRLTAAAELEAELSFPLSWLVGEALDALRRRPMRERIAAVAPDLGGGVRDGRWHHGAAGPSTTEEATGDR